MSDGAPSETEPSTEPKRSSPDPAAARGPALWMGVFSVIFWLALGLGNPLTALTVTLCTANLGLVVIPFALKIPTRWYHVPNCERWLHLALGVPLFGWLLDRSGWNRNVALPMRQLEISRANLPRLLLYIHAAEGAHAIAFVPHVVLAALAYGIGQPWGGLWLLLPGVILHFYPVLLQRWMTLRVASLMKRTGIPA